MEYLCIGVRQSRYYRLALNLASACAASSEEERRAPGLRARCTPDRSVASNDSPTVV